MKEIKFRAWNKDEKIMHEEAWLVDGTITIDLSRYDLSGYEDLKNAELMQFTGLLDKNGKEIYEGDIVKLKSPTVPEQNGTNEIIYEEDFARFSLYFRTKDYGKSDNYGCDAYVCGIDPEDELEVIGNIYQNPKLLK